ncbi:hypothetical protein HY993_01475 [Candidatus Micrarchaeota archaeon]|nr:hypothetical protein [Candidatus Micrarchaeota archaeon]
MKLVKSGIVSLLVGLGLFAVVYYFGFYQSNPHFVSSLVSMVAAMLFGGLGLLAVFLLLVGLMIVFS